MDFSLIFKALCEYGLAGVVLAACGWYIFKRDSAHETVLSQLRTEHREERAELTATLARQHAEAMQTQKESNTILSSLTTAVTELSTLFRDRR